MRFTPSKISLLVSSLFLAGGVLAQSTSNVGSITVEGNPGGTDSGLIQQEDTPKARSSINRDFIQKQAPTSNPFQLLNLLPGVNAFSQDASGLFGGGMRVRGFNTDQLGFTIDGAPVNDSGNFAVYPQEYTDAECIDNIFVTQGSTDVEAPHVGASGGNIGINTITPLDERNVRIAQTVGSNNLSRTFARLDSGKLGPAKFTVCASKSRVDKFKGPGRADRDHIDFKANVNLGGGNVVTAGFLYNRAVNANIRALNKNQFAQFGDRYDFGSVAPVHQPFAGSTVNDPAYGPNAVASITSSSGSIGDSNRGYYGFNLNPFENAVATLNGTFKLADRVMLNVNPYFWYGYGTGGNQLQTLTDSAASGAKVHGGIAPFYSPTITGNTIFVYNGSVTHTDRPGINVKVDADLSSNNRLTAGIWYERARHRQTGPYVQIDNAGNAADVFMDNPNQWLRYNDGTPVEYRNYYTISTGKSAYVQDNISLIDTRLVLALGLSNRSITRDFTNTASGQQAGYGADYSISRTYSDLLPNIGAKYQISKEQSLFFNAAQNFRAPANYVLSGLVTGGTIANGVLTGWTLRNPVVDKETSNNYDFGYRLQNDSYTLSASLYRIDFQNRIATSYDPSTALSTDMNVGTSRTQGIELESGWRPAAHWSLYGSLTFTDSKINEDKVVVRAGNGTWVALPTTGKQFPDTPRFMAGLGAQYASGGWFAYGQAKYMGKRYTTLVNDDSIGGYTVVNAGAGFEFPSTAFFKKPQIKFNVHNLFDTGYLNLNAGSGSSFRNNAAAYTASGGAVVAASLPGFYVGAPRAVSLTLQSDF
jgi:iron complex outermembrane receptor protein